MISKEELELDNIIITNKIYKKIFIKNYNTLKYVSLTNIFNINDQIKNLEMLKNLKNLHLNNNKLTTFDLVFDKLKYLSLKDNNIIDMTNICKNIKLVNISLQNNKIEYIPSIIQNLTNLTTLNLINNNISDINDLSNHNGLKYLFLDKNILTEVKLKSNTILSLSIRYNYLKSVKLNIKSLLTLNLTNNKINNLLINKTAYIKVLDLDNSICKYNINCFKFNPKHITTLNLSNNDLTNIKFPFKQLLNITNLSINNCIINNIILNEIYDLKTLKHLYIENIKPITKGKLKKLKKLSELNNLKIHT